MITPTSSLLNLGKAGKRPKYYICA
uniref:Uncharacterized protein n=1 Tax=Anguilla anguilla TaxID=7936 RepID=A0A0E9VJJ5_ANGAN